MTRSRPSCRSYCRLMYFFPLDTIFFTTPTNNNKEYWCYVSFPISDSYYWGLRATQIMWDSKIPTKNLLGRNFLTTPTKSIELRPCNRPPNMACCDDLLTKTLVRWDTTYLKLEQSQEINLILSVLYIVHPFVCSRKSCRGSFTTDDLNGSCDDVPGILAWSR